jgi:hypothetical protein
MLRLSKISRIAAAAAALLISTASLAQGGLGGRITDAGTKLDQDVQGCKPVNIGEYTSLLQEAGQNKRRAEKAAKAGVPINQAQVDADLANALALFNRAHAALIQQCMRAAQGQGQPQSQPQTTPTPAATPVLPGAAAGQACAPRRAMVLPRPNYPVPTRQEVSRIGEQLEDAVNNHRFSESEFLLEGLDLHAADLRKKINDAKQAGEFSTIDVKEAEARLEQIEKWRAWGRRHVVPCPPLQPQPPTQTSLNLSPFDREVLAMHNSERSAFGAPPLRWNPELAAHATARAQQMAQAGQLVHAPREGRGAERENIIQAPAGYSAGQMMGRWTREKADFVPGIFPNVCRSGDWSTCAHYSQMLWPQTTDVGCGGSPGFGFNWYVCRYFPGGNKDGKPVGVPISIASGPTTPPPAQPPDLGPHGGTMSARTASQFDLGIYAGGAWTTDWFAEPPSQLSPTYEYGYDSALFVGYDLGAFRLEAEAAYKKEDTAWLDGLLALPETFVDTKVEQPQLGAQEIYNKPPPTHMVPEQVYALSLHAEEAAKNGDVAALQNYAREARRIADGTKNGQISYLSPAYAEQIAKQIEGMLQDATPVQTSVQQPQLPNQEVFKPAPPEKLEDPM